MVGSVSAGKTSFLIALWQVLFDSKSGHAVAFQAMPKIRDRLNDLQSSFLACRPIPRTPLSDENDVELGTVAVGGGSSVALCIPDRAGESFDQQWVYREVSSEYAQTIRAAKGILLFVNPEYFRSPRNINSKIKDLASIAGIQESAETSDGASREREPLDAPTQVISVELLQFIENLCDFKNPKLAVMISAWDLVEAEGLSPAAWLDKRAPLLAQYIRVNASRWRPEIYGVSALGGDITRDRERLLAFVNPSARPYVVDSGGTRLDDFTLPIASLLA